MILKTLLTFVASAKPTNSPSWETTFSNATAADLKTRGVDPNPFEVGVALNTFYDVHIPEEAMWNVQFDLDANPTPTHEEILAKLRAEMQERQRRYDEAVHQSVEGRIANALLSLGERRLSLQCRLRARVRFTIDRLRGRRRRDLSA